MRGQLGTEHRLQLALGLDPVDALSERHPARPLRIDLEHADGWWVPRGPSEPYFRPVLMSQPRAAVSRHNSGRHVLVAHPSLDPSLGDDEPPRSVTLRIYDHERRYVPRRLRIPLVPPKDYADPALFDQRRRRPFLYPGAGYDVPGSATGLRGRVTRDGTPMRWARIEARLASNDVLVGRAWGDDRGEFLLILRSVRGLSDIDLSAAQATDESTISIRVRVAGPPLTPPPDAAPDAERDAFWRPPWDPPLEEEPGAADPTPDAAELMPDGTTFLPFGLGYQFDDRRSREVRCPLGRTLTGLEDFIFSLP